MSYEKLVKESENKIKESIKNNNLSELELTKLFLKHECLLNLKNIRIDNKTLEAVVLNRADGSNCIEIQMNKCSIFLDNNGKWHLDKFTKEIS